MAITVIESPERFEALRPEWEALMNRSPTAHLFNTHDWLFAWWRAFAKPEDRLRIYGVRREGVLVAVAPLMLAAPAKPAQNGAPPALASLAAAGEPRRLTGLFNHYTGRSDLLFDPAHPGALAELLAGIRAERQLWDVLELPQVPEDSPVFEQLGAGGAAGLSVYGVRNIASPFLELGAWAGYEGWYAARFSSRKRQQDRRRLRQAEKLGGFRLRVLTAPAEVEAALEQGLDVEDSSWKGESESSIKRTPGAADFIRAVVARFARREQVAYVSLELEGRQAAFLLGFVFRGCFYFHKTGYDPAHSAVSPGRIVLLRSLEEAFARGLARYDFLGAPDDYKLQCAPTVRPHATLFLYHEGFRSRWARTVKRRVVPAAKTLLRRGTPFQVRLDH